MGYHISLLNYMGKLSRLIGKIFQERVLRLITFITLVVNFVDVEFSLYLIVILPTEMSTNRKKLILQDSTEPYTVIIYHRKSLLPYHWL